MLPGLDLALAPSRSTTMRTTLSRARLAGFAAGTFFLPVLLVTAPAAAQCTNPWLTHGSTAADGTVYSSVRQANGDLVAGGSFATIGGTGAARVARWDGTSWSPLGGGCNNTVLAVTALPNGDVVAGGWLTSAGGTPASRIARFDGTSWHAMGSGVSDVTDRLVYALATMPNGDVVAGGNFQFMGGQPVNHVARWDGTSWHALGGGLNNAIRALVPLPNGELLAAGDGMSFPFAQPAVWRWNGTSWSPLGLFPQAVASLVVMPNGDVIAGGIQDFSLQAHVARWTGSSWQDLGAPANLVIQDLLALPNGDLLAGGWFSTIGGIAANRIARWNGSSWSAVSGGVDAQVEDLTALANGDVFVGGQFTVAGGAPSRSFAVLTTTCPATSVPFAGGCNSSGGSNTMTVTSLPWVDATFRAVGTGLPTTAIVIAETSVSAIVPGLQLDTVFAQAPPGCALHVVPDIQQVLVTTTGTAESSLFLPNTPPLVGVTFFHQMIPIEIDAMVNFVEITATNAVQLTAGMF
jgi:hypothetical protein